MFGHLNSPLKFLFNVLVCLSNYIVVIAMCIAYPIICIGAAALGLTLAIFCGFRLRSNLTRLRRQLNYSFSWRYIDQFIHYDIRTFELIFIGNDIFGRLLVAFLVVNIPISAYVIVLLSLGLAPTTRSAILLSAFPGHELFGCVVIHWFAAKVTARLHSSSKMFLNLMSNNAHRVGNLRARIKLSLTIDRLHTKHRYGVTYGAFGLVSMASFGKVC